MHDPGRTPLAKSKYEQLLGSENASKLLKIFDEIEKGKYKKDELVELRLKDLEYPLFMRTIRADMQSFVNAFIDPYLEKKPFMNDTAYVIDAGANIGYTAILFANWWPKAKIISIEPDPENYQLALKNTKAYSNVIVVLGSVWNKDMKLKIEAGQEDGFVVREIKDGGSVDDQNLTKGISIDQLMKTYNMPRIDFLKMNIEGSEKEVFSENYTQWLPKTKAMLIELHDGKNKGCARAVFNATNQYEFAVAETSSYGILFARETEYREWYAKWYKEEIYEPNINKERFPEFYLDKD
jgi:FkbM family methyltransferase